MAVHLAISTIMLLNISLAISQDIIRDSIGGITATQILEEYISALGGREALAAINDRTMDLEVVYETSRYHIPLDGEKRVIYAYPDKLYFKETGVVPYPLSTIIGGETIYETWVNGEKVVTTNPVYHYAALKNSATKEHRYIPLEGKTLAASLEDAQFNEVLRLDSLGYDVCLLNVDTWYNDECYFIEIVCPYSDMVWVINAKTFMRTGIIYRKDGKRTKDIEFENFKPVDGVMLPYHYTQRSYDANGKESSIVEGTITAYKQNTYPPDSLFEKALK